MPIRKLEGTLLFVQVQNPVDCYEKSKGKEWKASIAVDEDTADAWNEDYPKQPALAVKTSEFEAKYKTTPPNPSAKKQYVITLRKNTKLGNGDEVPDIYKPKILVPQKNGENKDVTADVLVGNGSKGAISVDVWEMSKGSVARLKNILVTDLVEYVKPEGSGGTYTPGDEFAESKKEAKSSSKPKAKAKAEEEEEEDAPF